MRSVVLSSLVMALVTVACVPAEPSASTLRPKPSSERRGTSVSLRYLGVAGWQLNAGPHTLLFDPYFTRANVKDGAAPLTPDENAIARYAPAKADVILVGHSHYDHVLDVPSLARRTGALVAGTESTLHVATAAGLPPSRLHLARPGDRFETGPFHVQALRGLHSLIGIDSMDIPAGITLPLPADAYGEGGTLQYLVDVEGRRVLFIGTANFVEAELRELRPDVAIVATGLREKVPDYTCRLMRVLGEPPLVLTNHFDAHWQPLGAEQMAIGEEGERNLAAFAEEVKACAPRTKVVVPVHLESLGI